jgi:hypothetical protein
MYVIGWFKVIFLAKNTRIYFIILIKLIYKEKQ